MRILDQKIKYVQDRLESWCRCPSDELYPWWNSLHDKITGLRVYFCLCATL